MAEISIIIRTKNEERWIGHCLAMVFNQTFKDFEVILVDNNSDDHTVKIAKRFPIRVITIDEFRPGYALNKGIEVSCGRYIVCLSAHCIPKDEYWLQNLIKNFRKHEGLAGVYGRQLPVSFTDPIDKRDLLIVFGQEHRIQKKDYFFHNANSMIARQVWEKFPFDERVSNIEDRVWGKQVVEAGYILAYEPDASVYHHHGLHQGNDARRAQGVVSILERVDREILSGIPASLLPERSNVYGVILLKEVPDNLTQFEGVISEILNSRFIKTLLLISPENIHLSYSKCRYIPRNALNIDDNANFAEALRQVLLSIEEAGECPDSILYVNPLKYPKVNSTMLDELVSDMCLKGLDTVFFAEPTYDHIWKEDGVYGYLQVDPSLEKKELRKPLLRAMYGLGCITSAAFVRKGKLLGDRVGIVKI